jgi:hypothetical protein
VDLQANPCPTGNFTLEVTVCDTKGEMIIAGIPTIADETILHSRMEMDLRIKNHDQFIPLAHGKQFRILVNDPDPVERMELFYGQGDRWIQADGNPDTWDNVVATDWIIPADSTQTTFITGFGYETFSDSTDWINVDQFVLVPEHQRTTVCVELPATFHNANTVVYLAFNHYNSVVVLTGDADTKQFCEPYGATPIGFAVTIVVLAELGENTYYFVAKETTITPEMTVSLMPLPTPYEEIKTFLKEL